MYFIEKRLTIPTSPVFIFLVNVFSVTSFRTFFPDNLLSFNWWAVSVGGEELKWCQLAHHHLMSQQGPCFSPHSKPNANDKGTNLRRNGI